MSDAPRRSRAVFMVIFGAGASNDSVPPEEVRRNAQWQPPVAADLFSNRPNFRTILGQPGIREAMPIAHEMRRLAVGETVEQRLEQLVERSARYQPLQRQLLALQFYLQQLLWDCGQLWAQGADHVTNYSELVGRLDRWRFEHDHDVVYVTFNYDTLLETSLPDSPVTVQGYIEGNPRVYKVHGSTNWGRRAISPTLLSRAGDMRPHIIREAGAWATTDDFVVLDDVMGVDASGHPLLPVIAVPTLTKSGFAMPAAHLLSFRRDLAAVRGVLVVGWKGNEFHFLKELKLHLPTRVPFDVVSPGDPAATARKLRQIRRRIRARTLKWSFTQYMNAPQQLDALLQQSLSSDRSATRW